MIINVGLADNYKNSNMAQHIVFGPVHIVKELNIGVSKIDPRLSCSNQDHFRQEFIGFIHD